MKETFMKMKGLVFLAVLATCSLSLAAQNIGERQQDQQARIKQGVQSGELTRGEAQRLEAQQGRIEANKLIDKSKGPLTPQERAQLTREQNRASRDIYRLKHNERERPRAK
jgi:hypothetical protein